MKLRLLISGSKKNTNTIGAFIIQNFDGSFPFEVLEYPDVFARLVQSKIYRLIYRFLPLLIVRKMDYLFLRQVERFNPTVILIFKGMEISKYSLARIRAKGVKLVNYNFDHPFDFFSRGTGNRFVREAIPMYDLHISYSARIARDLADQFQVRTACLPFASPITQNQFDTIIQANRPEINRTCFVGNPDRQRVMAIAKLISSGIPVDVYGFGWERMFQKSNSLLTIHLPRNSDSYWSDPLEFWTIIRQYRVQLNFFRPHNMGSHNLRTFEVPSVGGILLTPASDEQAGFFVPEDEIFFYTDQESLCLKCNMLLQLDALSASEIRKKARLKSVEKDYSYVRRTNEVLAILERITQP